MIGGLWNGFSGIGTYERAINNTSNNSTNINTVGHKSNEIRFEDLMYKGGYGKGSTVETIDKRMDQGDIKPTNNPFDVAIEGRGFFIVTDEVTKETYYSRAGNFKMGADGTLQNLSNMRVMGIKPLATQVTSTDANDNQFKKEHSTFLASQKVSNNNGIYTINSRASDYSKTATDTGISGEGFKTKSANLIDIEALRKNYILKLDAFSQSPNAQSVNSQAHIVKADFSKSLNELKGENDSLSIVIDGRKVVQQFDTDVETTLKKFADNISNMEGVKSTVDINTGIVSIESMIAGNELKVLDGKINDSFVGIETSQLQIIGSGQAMVDTARNALKAAIENAKGEFIELKNEISLASQNNIANVSPIQLKLAELNLSENSFGTMSIEEGYVYLSDGNNKFLVGKIQTAYFTNEQGLQPFGDNVYKASDDSGVPKYSATASKLISNSLELGNTSTSDTMSNLLVFQKAFEANSKTITTSDEMLKTAIALKK